MIKHLVHTTVQDARVLVTWCSKPCWFGRSRDWYFNLVRHDAYLYVCVAGLEVSVDY